jgi:hypothetical protein
MIFSPSLLMSSFPTKQSMIAAVRGLPGLCERGQYFG